MRLLLLLLPWFLLLGTAARSAAQQPGPPGRIYRGQVLDTSRRPLAGATLFVKGTHTAVTTNSEGRFELALPAGAFELLVDYPGHLAPPVRIGGPDSVLTVVLRSTQPPVRRR